MTINLSDMSTKVCTSLYQTAELKICKFEIHGTNILRKLRCIICLVRNLHVRNIISILMHVTFLWTMQ
jgi:hypothetical protein